MASYVRKIQPGVLWVMVDPGVTSRTIGDHVFMEKAKQTVTVRAETEVLTKQVILSCGFCQFDESDLVWAIPMGMAKIERRPLKFGDRINLSAFVKDDNRDLVCIQPPELHVTRESLTSIAVFGVVKTCEFVLPGYCQLKAYQRSKFRKLTTVMMCMILD